MAISELGQSKSLFERLPDRLFSPLASTNRHQYWHLLCALSDKRFGVDAPIPPSHGFTSREIHKDIEEEFLTMDPWETEVDQGEDTLAARAAAAFSRLRESGWLRIERHGVREMITMAPAVAQFLARLIDYAQTGPLFVAGKVRSIEANLTLIVQGAASGDTLQEAAAQARNLIEHVRNTSTNVRDIMGSFNVEMTTAQYVKRFFNDFIERVFIGDYRELRTREHPLSRRQEIVRTVEEIHADDTQRRRLLEWYTSKRCAGDAKRAVGMFERDISRLLDIKRIDEYLDRLDDEVRRANKRALAFLDYRLRSARPVDLLVNQAIEALLAHPTLAECNPFAPGELMSSARLAESRRDSVKLPSVSLRAQVISPEEQALASLRLKARDRRSVTPPKLTDYVRGQLEGADELQSADLAASTIEQIRYLQVLQATTMAFSSGSSVLKANAMLLARGFTPEQTTEQEEPGRWISGVPYVLRLRKWSRKVLRENE